MNPNMNNNMNNPLPNLDAFNNIDQNMNGNIMNGSNNLAQNTNPNMNAAFNNMNMQPMNQNMNAGFNNMPNTMNQGFNNMNMQPMNQNMNPNMNTGFNNQNQVMNQNLNNVTSNVNANQNLGNTGMQNNEPKPAPVQKATKDDCEILSNISSRLNNGKVASTAGLKAVLVKEEFVDKLKNNYIANTNVEIPSVEVKKVEETVEPVKEEIKVAPVEEAVVSKKEEVKEVKKETPKPKELDVDFDKSFNDFTKGFETNFDKGTNEFNIITNPKNNKAYEEAVSELDKFDDIIKKIDADYDISKKKKVDLFGPIEEDTTLAFNKDLGSKNQFDDIKLLNIDTNNVLSELELTMKSLSNIVGALNTQRKDLTALQDKIFEKEALLNTRESKIKMQEEKIRDADNVVAEKLSQLNEEKLSLKNREANIAFRERELNAINRKQEDEMKKNLEYAEILREKSEDLRRREYVLDQEKSEFKREYELKTQQIENELNNIISAKKRFDEIVRKFNETIQEQPE